MVIPYGEPVTVTVCRDDQRPTSFTWRGQRYWICVLASWRLRHRWGCPESAGRTYYRVLCADIGQRLFELSHDPASDAWLLDAIPDSS